MFIDARLYSKVQRPMTCVEGRHIHRNVVLALRGDKHTRRHPFKLWHDRIPIYYYAVCITLRT